MSRLSRMLTVRGWSGAHRGGHAGWARRLLSVGLSAVLALSPLGSGSLSAGGGEAAAVNRWCLQAINVPVESAETAREVRVALIDSGCSIAADWAGADRVVSGHNYVFGTGNTADLVGHGTQVASIILGCGTAAEELVGFSQRIRVVPLVWISKYASGVLANGGVAALAAAIRDAVDVHACRVISISSGITRDDPELRAAVAHAEEQGAVVVAAVGNSNLYAPEQVFYPAAYSTVVGVGSVNSDLQVSAWSQRNGSVTLTAPGERVYALSRAQLRQVSGTSFAAAQVTAGVARLLSSYPDLTAADVRSLLQKSARDMGDAGYDNSYGYGMLDLGHCLELAAQLTSGGR